MNTKMHSAIAAWTLFSLLNRSEEHSEWVKESGLGVEEVHFSLIPGYNQATAGQTLQIELDEIENGRFVWRLNVPKGIRITTDKVEDTNRHIWTIQAANAGRYKIVADYIDKKRMSRIRKRVVFEVEALPCPGGDCVDRERNTTK